LFDQWMGCWRASSAASHQGSIAESCRTQGQPAALCREAAASGWPLTASRTLGRHIEQIDPMTAGLAVQATVGLRDLPIVPWAG
jgi:hypothetical protein